MNERLMSESDWANFAPFFSVKENWGDPERVTFQHATDLWMIRKRLLVKGHDWPIVVHCSFEESGHAPKSYHHHEGVSRATDFHFHTSNSIEYQHAVLEQTLSELSLECGLGIYPEWNTPGFHFDSRGFTTRWIVLSNAYHFAPPREIMSKLLTRKRRT